MLDKDHIQYILNHYSRLMTLQESAAFQHYDIPQSYKDKIAAGVALPDFIQRGVSSDPEVLALLDNGIEVLRAKVAERIETENPGRIFYNNCPKCNRLARTNKARQCRCGHSWHEQFVGEFTIATTFQLNKRGFYIIGQLTSGRVATGMRVDLSVINLAIRPIITGVEFVDKMDGKEADLALCLLDISEDDKEFLKTGAPFIKPIPVMK